MTNETLSDFRSKRNNWWHVHTRKTHLPEQTACVASFFNSQKKLKGIIQKYNV